MLQTMKQEGTIRCNTQHFDILQLIATNFLFINYLSKGRLMIVLKSQLQLLANGIILEG